MTSADNYFWTYEQAISYYKFAMINYIGFQDKGMLLAGGCGDTNGKPQIDKTNHLRDAYNFGKNIYREQSPVQYTGYGEDIYAELALDNFSERIC